MSITARVFLKGGSSGGVKGSNIGNMRGILETCINVTRRAKLRAPVDTARLRNSISYKTFERNKNNDKPTSLVPTQFEGYVGTNVDYAIYQEFGTRFQAPQSFLRPAAVDARNPEYAIEVQKIMVLAMQEWTEKQRARIKRL